MADNFLGYQNPTSVDAKLDTESLTVGANTVHRERIEIAGASATDIAVVTAANGLQVDVTRSALPSGASTSAKQDTGNTSLSSIDTKTPALGQALAAASVPIVLTAAQITTLTPPAAITGFATSTKQSDGSQKTQIVDGSGNVIGATSNAIDINIKSGNLTTLPVTNAGTFAVQSTPVTQADTFMLGGVNIKEINAVAPLMGNGVTGTGSQRVTIASDNTAFAVNATLSAETTKVIGTINIASAQTLATVTNVATIGTSVTPGTAAGNLGKAEDAAHASGDTGVAAWGVRNDNLATTFGNDQDYGPLATDLNGRVMVSQKAATATLASVSTSTTSATLISANSARIGATITNEAATVLFVKFGTTASATSYVVSLAGAAAAPYSYYEVPAGYTGRIDGILASSTGTARVTEIT